MQCDVSIFFSLKMLCTRKTLSIKEFNYNSGIQPLNFNYNKKYITSNYANNQIVFFCKRNVLRKTKIGFLSQVNKKIIEFLIQYGYNEINDDLTDDSLKAIQLFKIGIKIVRHCLKNDNCINNLL